MTEEILVNCTCQEVRVALVEGGTPQEILIERNGHQGIVGNLYCGRVTRVLPGMGAAFVEIGTQRTAFLHVSDIAQAAEGDKLPIDALLREGQMVLGQISKDPLGAKGARLSTQIALPSRYLVYLPHGTTIGISQRIHDEEERRRLKELLTTPGEGDGGGGGGFILRTAAAGVEEARLRADAAFLRAEWEGIEAAACGRETPDLVHQDLPLLLRVVRDMARDEVERILIDDPTAHAQAMDYAQRFAPDIAARIALHEGEAPLFDLHCIEQEIDRALERKVELRSGGYLIIDQTEALTTVDVNTGGFVGRRNLEETIFKTNIEAAQAIARQLRLRNLGGIIIVDFIDMLDPEHRRQVQRALEKHCERDPARIAISDLSTLGLVQITRKRSRESLGHVLCVPCPTCSGRGVVRSVETVGFEIAREILRRLRQTPSARALVVAAPEVVDWLQNDEASGLQRIESQTGCIAEVKGEPLYTREQYDVVLR